jgi:sulfate adenylyltransferase (ADP) / ATP adenylyltransferase
VGQGISPFPFEIDGGSQQHKHVQLIPLPPHGEFKPFPDKFDTDKVQNDTSLPFQHYVCGLPFNRHSDTLYETYNRLLGDVKKANPEKNLSYNFVMTTDWMFISPRSKDDYIGNGQKVAVNSTGMVGLLLAKSQEQSDFIENIGPMTVLADVGKPWSQTEV